MNADKVIIECPRCSKSIMDKRRDTDYHDTHKILLICSDCDDGDFHAEHHFDVNGKEIVRDPMLEPEA